MVLNYDNRVLFEPNAHLYLLDGEKLLMGVTALMEKHHLSPDYGDFPGKDKVLARAAEIGTEIHREIQDYDDGKSVFTTPLIEQYRDICSQYGLKSLASEYPVSDYELVASAIDKVYALKRGVVLVDIKTTSEYHKRPLEYQLGIYKYLFEKKNPKIPVKDCYCLWIDKKTRKIRDFIKVEPVDGDEVEKLLKAEREGVSYTDPKSLPSLGDVLDTREAETLVANAAKIAELKAKAKALEDADKAVRMKLLNYMTANKITSLEVPGGKFVLRSAYKTTKIDPEKVRLLYPSIIPRVTFETVTSASISFKPNKE